MLITWERVIGRFLPEDNGGNNMGFDKFKLCETIKCGCSKPEENDSEKNIDKKIYAKTESEAEARHNKYGKVDPYPLIASALLNSADIAAYVKATALIYPFYEERLKGASYDVTIKGSVVYWKFTDSGKVEKKTIQIEKKGDCFDLEPNSIAFVTLEPMFRIPTYLALRFNLKITHIYKGLLLGTGPLVDPGFSGKLSIPLHNLTSNTYRFLYGEELITMEFTKLSPNVAWIQDSELINSHDERYVENIIKSNRTVDEYIAKALEKDRLDKVISSIPDAVEDCKKEVRSANKAVKKMQRVSLAQAAISVIAVCGLVFSAVTLSLNAINKANDRYDSLYKEYMDMKTTYESKIDSLQDDIEQLTNEVNKLQDQDNIKTMY